MSESEPISIEQHQMERAIELVEMVREHARHLGVLSRQGSGGEPVRMVLVDVERYLTHLIQQTRNRAKLYRMCDKLKRELASPPDGS